MTTCSPIFMLNLQVTTRISWRPDLWKVATSWQSRLRPRTPSSTWRRLARRTSWVSSWVTPMSGRQSLIWVLWGYLINPKQIWCERVSLIESSPVGHCLEWGTSSTNQGGVCMATRTQTAKCCKHTVQCLMFFQICVNLGLKVALADVTNAFCQADPFNRKHGTMCSRAPHWILSHHLWWNLWPRSMDWMMLLDGITPWSPSSPHLASLGVPCWLVKRDRGRILGMVLIEVDDINIGCIPEYLGDDFRQTYQGHQRQGGFGPAQVHHRKDHASQGFQRLSRQQDISFRTRRIWTVQVLVVQDQLGGPPNQTWGCRCRQSAELSTQQSQHLWPVLFEQIGCSST